MGVKETVNVKSLTIQTQSGFMSLHDRTIGNSFVKLLRRISNIEQEIMIVEEKEIKRRYS